jgi:hypothetical protein
MADQWFYRLFGEEFGPVSQETLKSLLDIGTIGDSDEVRQEGQSNWTTAAQAIAAADRISVGTATATAVSTDDDQWYCQLLGQELGPLSFDDLLKFAEDGELSADDEVKLGAAGKWRKVGSIGRLVAVLPYRESQELRPAQAVDHKPADASPQMTSPVAPVAPPTPRYHPAAEENTWYAWVQGTEYGPMNLLQLSQWLSTGQLGPADMVKQGMLGQWMPSVAVGQALSRLTVAATPTSPPAPVPMASPTPAPRASIPAPPKEVAPVSRLTPPTLPPVDESKASPSKPPAETKPASATTSAAEAVIQRMATVQARNNAPADEVPARPATAGMSGGYGGSSSSASTWSPPSKPAARPPVKKPAASREPINWGETLGPLKDPKALGAIGVVVLVVLVFFGSSILPASSAGDRKKLEQLQQILAEFRENREKKASAAEWEAFMKKAEEVRKPIADELEKSANRKYPARQYLLWASRNRLPEMLQGEREKPGIAEEQFEGNLYDAAKILGVAKGEPPKASNAARAEVIGSSEGDAVEE